MSALIPPVVLQMPNKLRCSWWEVFSENGLRCMFLRSMPSHYSRSALDLQPERTPFGGVIMDEISQIVAMVVLEPSYLSNPEDCVIVPFDARGVCVVFSLIAQGCHALRRYGSSNGNQGCSIDSLSPYRSLYLSRHAQTLADVIADLKGMRVAVDDEMGLFGPPFMCAVIKPKGFCSGIATTRICTGPAARASGEFNAFCALGTIGPPCCSAKRVDAVYEALQSQLNEIDIVDPKITG